MVSVSIVIPSFQQAGYLPETLESILSQQSEVDLEIVVIDGGSTDGTVDWLEQNPHPAVKWISEPDDGQASAINKGLSMIKGDVWAYVNTDDPLLQGCLATVAEVFSDPKVMWVGGIGETFDESGIRGEIEFKPVLRKKDWVSPWNRLHPYVVPFSGCNFMRREVIDKIGSFDPTYHYSMDIEYAVRAVFEGGYSPLKIQKRMARWRWHPDSKTMKRGIAYAFREDEVRIAEAYREFLPKDEQYELDGELRFEKKMLVCRKTMGLHRELAKLSACRVLGAGLVKHPSLVGARPWWGALRQVLFA